MTTIDNPQLTDKMFSGMVSDETVPGTAEGMDNVTRAMFAIAGISVTTPSEDQNPVNLQNQNNHSPVFGD